MTFKQVRFDNPTVSESVEHLVRVAVRRAEQLGLRLVLEKSDLSEARYLHLLRQATWFGFRIACHLPHYDCSADYHQVIVPFDSEPNLLQRTEAYLQEALRQGGQVVADPAEVTVEIEAEEYRRVDGFLASDGEGNRWRWIASSARWIPEASLHRSRSTGPAFTPVVKLSSHQRCAIRHRLNHRAKWTFEERQALHG